MYKLIIISVCLILCGFSEPLSNIPQCPPEQCGVVLKDGAGYGVRYKVFTLRNDVDEYNQADVNIELSDITATYLIVGVTGATHDNIDTRAAVFKIPLGGGATVKEANSIVTGTQSFPDLTENGVFLDVNGATTLDNYINTDINIDTYVVLRIAVEYDNINCVSGNCGSTGDTRISVRSSAGQSDYRTLEVVGSAIASAGDDIFVYVSAEGGDVTVQGFEEECENADNYGGGLFCIENSKNAPKPLQCFIAIKPAGYDPSLPHYLQNSLQWTWDQARDECQNGNIEAGTVDLASLRTAEENNAAVAAMKAAGCQSAFFGLYNIQGYNDYKWVDDDEGDRSIVNDNRLWRGRNDPNAYTEDEASVGYMEVFLGNEFPACGYYFWADECAPVGKHPCAICMKYVTHSPTSVPTKTPSTVPTKEPSKSPSKQPTEVPTTSPTTLPSKHPTISPTRIPTKAPTTTPTTLPTTLPSREPTKAPSESPSTSPTKAPTTLPTKSPTILPTTSPSKAPTTPPTNEPSKDPTKIPTISPTTSPTKIPTSSPTKIPTKAPSTIPTTSPTKAPSTSPSKSPTKLPTTTPTTSPTGSPSTSPTKIPTKIPSTSPTKSPSITPTVLPTKAPTPSPTPQTHCECKRSVQFPRDIMLTPMQSPLYQYSGTFATYTIKDDKYIALEINANTALDLRICQNTDCIENPNSQIKVSIADNGEISVSAYQKDGIHIPATDATTATPSGITSISQINALYMVWDNAEFQNVGKNGDLVIGLGLQLAANVVVRFDWSQVFDYEDDHTFLELVVTSPGSEDGASADVCWYGSKQYNCEVEPLQTDCDIAADYLLAQYEGFNFNCRTDADTGEKQCEWIDSSTQGNNIDNQYFSGPKDYTTIDYGAHIQCVSTDPAFSCDTRNTLAIHGSTSDIINIVSPNGLTFLPSLYTLFTVARYPETTTNKGVIFGNDSPRFESGFGPNGEEGYAYHEDVEITASIGNTANLYDFSLTGNDFLLSTDQRSMYRGNGVTYTVKTPVSGTQGYVDRYSPFKINPNGNSEFEILEILIFNVELTQEQMKCIEYKYFEPKYTLTPLFPQCDDIDFPIIVQYPRETGKIGSQLEGFIVGDGSECDGKCAGTALPDCAGKRTLVNIRQTSQSDNLRIVLTLESGADYFASIIGLDGSPQSFPKKGGGLTVDAVVINPEDGANALSNNPSLASSDANPSTLVQTNGGMVNEKNSITNTVANGDSVLLTVEVNQYFQLNKMRIKIFNFEEQYVDVEYNAQFEQANTLVLRMGIDNDDQVTQILRLDNLRKQTYCFDTDYVDMVMNSAAKQSVKLNTIESNVITIKTSNKFYLILFIVTILINVVMIGFSIILWNKGAGNTLVKLFKTKVSKNKFAIFDSSDTSADESENDEDILVPAKKFGRKYRKGYAAIVPVSESDME